MPNYIKGKDNALTSFNKTRDILPLWKIHDSTKSHVVNSNLDNSDPDQSLELFKKCLNKLDPECMYTVSLFKRGRKSHGAANASYTFLNDSEEHALSGMKNVAPNEIKLQPPQQVPTYENTIQPPAPGERIGLSDHIRLIQDNATAQAKLMYLEGIISDQAKTISVLESEIKELEDENDWLQNELEEAGEEEEESVSGTETPTLESALAGLIKENGAAIMENLMSKKMTEDVSISETDNATVNGITADLLTRYSIDDLNKEMLRQDKEWHKHLFKLTQIAQQRPIMFKALILKLESF